MPARQRPSFDDMVDAPMDVTAAGDTEESAGPELQAARPVFGTKKKFGASEVTIPRLSIAQGLSQEVRNRQADVGDFLLAGFPPEKSVTLIIVGHTLTRRYVPQGQQRAQCYSPDGLQGIGTPGIACATCSLAEWSRDGDRNAPPPCSEIDLWACYSVTHGMAVQWPLKGTAAKASRFIKTLCNGLDMGEFAIEVTAESKSANGRSWSEPKVVLHQGMTAEECQTLSMVAERTFATMAAPAPVIPLQPVATAPAQPPREVEAHEL